MSDVEIQQTQPILPGVTYWQCSQHQSSLPLVIFLPWMRAPITAIEKYRNLYHALGLDVLVVQGDSRAFLWPNFGMRFAERLLEKLLTVPELKRRRYIVHSMSQGVYDYTLLLMVSKRNSKYSEFTSKISGQVFDSVVIGGLPRMVNGMLEAFNGGPVTKTLVKYTANLYFAVTKKCTVDFHSRAVDVFCSLPVKCPTLVFYSRSDPMSDATIMREMLDAWKAEVGPGIIVEKVWDVSPHAGHLLAHREEYVQVHSDFVKNVLLSSKL